MPEPFLSEIRIFSFNFPPKGWAFCNGQFLPINQNQALFSLLGTTYGGNGQTTFALPNLRGKLPMHMGNSHTLGESAGSTAVSVNTQALPAHIHPMYGTNNPGVSDSPLNRLPAKAPIYNKPEALIVLNPVTVTNAGGSQAHNNMIPYLVLNFCIALQGIFPSRN